MKVLVEANFFLEKAPSDFENIQIQKRTLYTWGSNRLQFNENSPYVVYSRATDVESIDSDDTNITEVWLPNNINPPTPPNPDDMWTEMYQELVNDNYTLEWFPNTNQLRIYWNQTIKTLIQGKILKQIQSELQNRHLVLPSIPHIQEQELAK